MVGLQAHRNFSVYREHTHMPLAGFKPATLVLELSKIYAPHILRKLTTTVVILVNDSSHQWWRENRSGFRSSVGNRLS